VGSNKQPILKASRQFDIPVHLVDVAEPGELYSAGQFVKDATQVIADMFHGIELDRMMVVSGLAFILVMLVFSYFDSSVYCFCPCLVVIVAFGFIFSSN
jgi:tRNA A37 N6-isopentenylltransferase MiaA